MAAYKWHAYCMKSDCKWGHLYSYDTSLSNNGYDYALEQANEHARKANESEHAQDHEGHVDSNPEEH